MSREIREDVLLEVLKVENAKGNPVVIRVVSWNGGEPKLEKRSFWLNEEGELRAGKNIGMTHDDFKLVLEKKEEIIDALTRDLGY
jgi:hypothetical protein